MQRLMQRWEVAEMDACRVDLEEESTSNSSTPLSRSSYDSSTRETRDFDFDSDSWLRSTCSKILAELETTALGTRTLQPRGGAEVSNGMLLGGTGDRQAPAWGYYPKVPTVQVLLDSLLVATQFAIYLALIGSVGARAETAMISKRGLINICAPGWSVASYASFSQLVLERRITALGGIGSALAFTAACTLLGSLFSELGLIVEVMAGVLLHFLAVVCWGICCLRLDGLKWEDAILPPLYWSAMFLCVLLTAFNGYATFIWWPWLSDRHNIASGVALCLSCCLGEELSVNIVKRLDKMYYKRVTNSRLIGAWAIMFIHCVSKSIRLVALWFSAIRRPDNISWISCLVCALFYNTFARLGWGGYIMFSLTKCTRFVPSCWTFVHNHARFAFAYGKFGAPMAVVGARFLLGTQEVLFFNTSVLSVWICSLLAEVVEDVAVVVCEQLHLQPNWYTGSKCQTVQQFVECINSDDPDDARASVVFTPDGRPEHKVRGKEEPFPTLFCHLSITNASTWMAFSGLAVFVSVDYLLGRSPHWEGLFDRDGLYNGALLWKPTA